MVIASISFRSGVPGKLKSRTIAKFFYWNERRALVQSDFKWFDLASDEIRLSELRTASLAQVQSSTGGKRKWVHVTGDGERERTSEWELAWLSLSLFGRTVKSANWHPCRGGAEQPVVT